MRIILRKIIFLSRYINFVVLIFVQSVKIHSWYYQLPQPPPPIPPPENPPTEKPFPPIPEPDIADTNAEFIEVILLFIECINAYVENLPLVKVPP